MSERYYPAPDFLNAVINEDVALTGSAFAEENLQRLIGMMKDADVANRDWATMLVAH